MDRVIPGAFDQALADADTFFGQELPAVRQWSFRRENASRITAWLPKAEPFVLAEANHLLHVQNPRGMAEGLAAFFGRHPLEAQ